MQFLSSYLDSISISFWFVLYTAPRLVYEYEQIPYKNSCFIYTFRFESFLVFSPTTVDSPHTRYLSSIPIRVFSPPPYIRRVRVSIAYIFFYSIAYSTEHTLDPSRFYFSILIFAILTKTTIYPWLFILINIRI